MLRLYIEVLNPDARDARQAHRGERLVRHLLSNVRSQVYGGVARMLCKLRTLRLRLRQRGGRLGLKPPRVTR